MSFSYSGFVGVNDAPIDLFLDSLGFSDTFSFAGVFERGNI